jgi:hypothetical protein
MTVLSSMRCCKRYFSALKSAAESKTLVYTGGCWLYGRTGDRLATEESPLRAPAALAWSVDHLRLALGASAVVAS